MARMADDYLVLQREWGSIILGVRLTGSMPALKFLEKLSVKERLRLEALLERMAREGKISNEQKFKQHDGKIYEFKSDQNRVLCFQSGNSWVLTHGFVKKSGKTRPEEIKKAKTIMKEHLAWIRRR